MTNLPLSRVDARLKDNLPEIGIGIVVPHDFVLDRELWGFVTRNVTLHITRTSYRDLDVSAEMAESVSDADEVMAAVRQLGLAMPQVVTYACTSGSYVHGPAGEAQLRTVMESAGAPIALTTSGAMLAAFEALGIRRVAIATPYDADLTRRLEAFLDNAGVEVVGAAYLDLRRDIFMVDNDTVIDLVVKADSPAAEAVFVSCTNLRTFDAIEPLEARLGKPVFTANQVTMWAALQAAGVSVSHVPHRLFAALSPSKHGSR